jgi:hypothetical protein
MKSTAVGPLDLARGVEGTLIIAQIGEVFSA